MRAPSNREFAVEKFLQDYGIDYKSRGKNVGRESVNVKCPKCDDPSYHLGIHKTGGYFGCWRCNFSGNFVSLISNLLDISYYAALNIAKRYQISGEKIEVKSKFSEPKTLDNTYSFDSFPEKYKKYRDLALKYLKSRHAPSDYILKCKFYLAPGKFGVVLPILDSTDPSAFQIRYIYHYADARYCKPDGIEFSKLLFNYDNVAKGTVDTLCLVEGIFDAFSCMPFFPTVAIFGTKISAHQLLKIRNLSPRRILFCFDGNMTKYEKKLLDIITLFPFVKEKIIVNLPSDKDPNDLGPQGMKELFKEYGVL